MNIPNILTAMRLVLIPFFGYSLYQEQYFNAFLFFLVSGFTDILDGHIARKFNMITTFGKLADPVADKLMQITALAILFVQGRIPVYILAVVVAKEAFMILGSILLLKKEKHVVSANWYGKMATAVFYFAVAVVIFFDLQQPYSGIIVAAAILPTLYAFFMYYFFYYREVKKGARPSNG